MKKSAGVDASKNGGWASPLVGRVATPLRDQVLTVVRQAILDFQLRPGQRLIERELVEQLGVSRTTVREVIALLISEGLVTVIPQKGAIVTVLSTDEAADIYEMRSHLEAMAVRRFVAKATPVQVKKLRSVVSDLERASRSRTARRDALAIKDAFYEVLFEGANSPALTQILSTLQGRVRFMRATSLSAKGRPVESAAELRKVVDLIEAGDADGAAEACAEHIRNAARKGLAELAEISTAGG